MVTQQTRHKSDSKDTFVALPGWYRFMYLYVEPISTIMPAILAWSYPGGTWFHQQLVPSLSSASGVPPLDQRTAMAVYQLVNCYFLLSMISSFVFRAVRDSLADNPRAQERIVGATLTALAIADFTHVITTLCILPDDLRWNILVWNPTTHGNVTFTILLFTGRVAWFAGVGRNKYHNRNIEKKSL